MGKIVFLQAQAPELGSQHMHQMLSVAVHTVHPSTGDGVGELSIQGGNPVSRD